MNRNSIGNAMRIERTRPQATSRRRGRRRFWRADSGSALVETITIAPIMIVFLVGILEFGALLYAKLEVETGLRAAARYTARCQNITFGCSDAMARNIAIYGNAAGTGGPRVQGWTTGDITITPAAAVGAAVRVDTNFNYAGSPLLSLIGLASITVTAFHEDRYIGF